MKAEKKIYGAYHDGMSHGKCSGINPILQDFDPGVLSRVAGRLAAAENQERALIIERDVARRRVFEPESTAGRCHIPARAL